jgi:urease accessory protein
MTLPFAAISPSDLSAEPSPRLQRSEGAARVSFKRERGGTQLERLFQQGAAKVRLPLGEVGEPPQAVLINTAGGLTGGDRMSAEVSLGAGCHAVVTSQACEKIYRSSSGDAEIHTHLSLAEDSRLDWLPQETILFDGARLSRRLDADLAPGAALLLVEATIFGRSARERAVLRGARRPLAHPPGRPADLRRRSALRFLAPDLLRSSRVLAECRDGHDPLRDRRAGATSRAAARGDG